MRGVRSIACFRQRAPISTGAHATTNYGLLYTAKGTASLLVPLANVLQVATGSWKVVFLVAAALNIVAAVMALVLLKPMRIKTMSKG